MKTDNTQLTDSLNQYTNSNELETTKEERDQLKKRISEYMKEIQDKDNTIEEMTLKINDLKEIEMKYFETCEDKQYMSKQIIDKEKDIDMNKISLENLQNALKEQQENYDWSINELEKDKSKNEEEIKKLNKTILNLQSELSVKSEDSTKSNSLETENVQLKSDYNQLLILKDSLSKELDSAREVLKTQELSKNYLIDRRVINQFLVQYLTHHSSPQIKKQMLETMASILDFTFEEKQILGILEKPKQEDKGDIGAKFLDFLMEEDEEV